MRTFLFLSHFLLFFSFSFAQHRETPLIPGRTFNVVDYGADKSGKTSSTDALQKALEQAKSAGGGKVTIPKGKYLSGPLKIYSHTELYFEDGAKIDLMEDIEHFPSEDNRYLNLIEGIRVTDVRISGNGIIDGHGAKWWEMYDQKQLTLRRPQLIYMDRPVRIEISGVTFLNPPNTHISIKNGTDVFIHHIKIEAPEKSHNTDGINISARFCSIEDCSISTGDDNIALNFSGAPKDTSMAACEKIVIRRCSFGKGHGLSIGSYTSGNLKGLIVSDCKFDGTAAAIRMKSSRGRGGKVQDVLYENINIVNSSSPVFLSAYYPKEPKLVESDTTTMLSAQTPFYSNIRFKNIKISNAENALRIWGLPERPLENIVFDNVQISSRKSAVINFVKNLKFISCSMNVSEGEKIKSFKADYSGL